MATALIPAAALRPCRAKGKDRRGCTARRPASPARLLPGRCRSGASAAWKSTTSPMLSLTHLPDVMNLPSVSVSIIPMRASRHGYRPRESFDITDTDLVTIRC